MVLGGREGTVPFPVQLLPPAVRRSFHLNDLILTLSVEPLIDGFSSFLTTDIMQPPPRRPVAAATIVLGVVVALTIARPASAQQHPDSSEPQDSLLVQIAELDARYFDAHNRCDLEALRALLAPDMEAYHDLGGSLEGRESFMEVMQGFCAHPERSRRELIPGTLEAHQIADFGAMHMADHRFYGVESGADMGSGRMIILWRRHHDDWHVYRTISYDHKPPWQ